MLYCVFGILENILKPRNEHETLIFQCVQSIYNFYRCMEHLGSDVEPARATKLGRAHILLYTELTRSYQDTGHFEQNGFHMYKFYPKHHMFVHLAEIGIQMCGNPKTVWCYGDEDQIVKLVEIAKILQLCVYYP